MKTRSGAAGVVIHEGKILLMYREKEGKKYHVFPGGGIESGETPEQAVVREFMEETSVTIKPLRELYYMEYDDNTDRHYFLCEYVFGEPRLGEDTNESREMTDGKQVYRPEWMALSELSSRIVYPLQIRDWVLEDIQRDFPNAIRKLFIEIATERQR